MAWLTLLMSSGLNRDDRMVISLPGVGSWCVVTPAKRDL